MPTLVDFEPDFAKKGVGGFRDRLRVGHGGDVVIPAVADEDLDLLEVALAAAGFLNRGAGHVLIAPAEEHPDDVEVAHGQVAGPVKSGLGPAGKSAAGKLPGLELRPCGAEHGDGLLVNFQVAPGGVLVVLEARISQVGIGGHHHPAGLRRGFHDLQRLVGARFAAQRNGGWLGAKQRQRFCQLVGSPHDPF